MADYVHPIIQAMADLAQGNQARAQLALANKKDAEDQANKQAELNEVIRQHDQEYQINGILRKIEQQRADGEQQFRQLQEQEIARKAIMEGARPTRADVTVPGQLTQTQFGPVQDPSTTLHGVGDYNVMGIPVNPDQMETPEQAFSRQYNEQQQIGDLQAQNAGKVTTAQQTALAPFEKAKQAEQEKIDFFNRASAERINRATRDSAERIATLNNDTKGQVAVLNAQARLEAAKNGQGADAGTINNYINDMYLTGNAQKIPINVKLQNAIRTAVPSGWTPIDPKEKDQLQGIGLIKDLIDKNRQLAQLGSSVGGRFGALTGTGDAGNLKQEVDGLMGNVARLFGRESGRLTNQDIDRAQGLVYSAKQSQANNLQKADDLEKLLVEKITPIIQKYPKDQRDRILGLMNIDPTEFEPKSSSPGTVVDYRKKYNY